MTHILNNRIYKRLLASIATIGVILAGAALFSAFESHVINVTARIENALSVPTDALAFGTVFPQEYLTRDVRVVLSDSFQGAERVDDVEYVIKQKPKVKDPVNCLDEADQPTTDCADPNINPLPGDPYANIEVGAPYNFEGVAWRFCEENLPPDAIADDGIGYTVDLQDIYWRYCYLPLANSLSKHELTTDGTEQENDTSVDAFHQAYVWASSTSSLNPDFIALGRLVKSAGDTEDSWQIDLKVPCFVNHCAQEADDETNDIDDETPGFFVPAEFRLDPATEHLVFGTDLWIEVSGISLPPTTTEPSTLTVTKVVVNDNEGTATTSDFSFMVDGGSAIPFEVDGSNVMNATSGPHTVAEVAADGYTATFSGDCDATGNVTVPASGNATCTITNNDNPPLIGTLTVNKVVVNDNGGTATTTDFALNVSGTAVTSGISHDFAPGNYSVAEAGLFGYSASFSGDCAANGTININGGDDLTCTITNNDIPPAITITKSVVGGLALPDDFDLSLDGSTVTSGSSNQVSANAAHAINEETLVAGYEFTSISGSSFLGVPCPAALNGTITLAPGDVVTCTITNTFNQP